MTWWHRLLRQKQMEEQLDKELRFHLDQHTADLMAQGHSREEAIRQARLALGGPTQVKESCRDARGTRWIEDLFQDLRYALRTLRASPGFTLVAVVTLALGIGANTAIYSFIDSILLRSLPVKHPESLVVLNWQGKRFGHPAEGIGQFNMSVITRAAGVIYPDSRGGIISPIFPYSTFELLQRNSVLSDLFAYCRDFGKFNIKVQGRADMANVEYVSGNYFPGLGVTPAAGRLLISDDDRTGSPAVAVMSYANSVRRFGNPGRAVGAAITINNVPFTVAGVAPPEFFGVDPSLSPDVFLPMHATLLVALPDHFRNWYADQHAYWIQIMGRLRPGVSREQAQAQLAPMFHQWVLTTASNDSERADLPQLVLRDGAGGVDSLRRRYSKPLFVLLTMVGLILAITCANIANLLLARAMTRGREIAVRLSIGASRSRVIRQLLTESVLLTCFGGALGILVALWGMRFLGLLLAKGRPNFTLHAEMNSDILALTAALSIITGIVVGLTPAIQSTRTDVMTFVKEQTARHRSRLGVKPSNLLVAAQISISLLFLVGAGLFVRTLSNLQSIQVGFNRDHLLLFGVDARLAGRTPAELPSFYRKLRTEFQAIPGVRSATFAGLSMLQGGRTAYTLRIHGKETMTIGVLEVGPSFLRTMQIPILAGADIEDRGRAVAVVDETFAKTYFPNESPLGQHIDLVGQDTEIVGICGNAHYGELKASLQPVIYDLSPPLGGVVFDLRTAGNPLVYANTVREIVRKSDPGVPVTDMKTEITEIDEQTTQETTFAHLCSAFAILSLAIACVGLYGALSYDVAHRTDEIGIRMALGADRGKVIWMVLREVGLLAAAGLAIGIPAALGASKLVASFLYGTKPNDPPTVIAAAAILVTVALVAGYIPARRASRIDPMSALRHE